MCCFHCFYFLFHSNLMTLTCSPSQSSSQEDFHLKALTEPCVKLSLHTALRIHRYDIQPRAQCANILGSLFVSF